MDDVGLPSSISSGENSVTGQICMTVSSSVPGRGVPGCQGCSFMSRVPVKSMALSRMPVSPATTRGQGRPILFSPAHAFRIISGPIPAGHPMVITRGRAAESCLLSISIGLFQQYFIPARHFPEIYVYMFIFRRGKGESSIVRLYGQLSSSPVNQYG